MTMTKDEKLTKLLEELGGLLRTKDSDINIKNILLDSANKKIEDLQKKISALEEENKELEKENTMLEDALRDAEKELDKYKGGADPYVD